MLLEQDRDLVTAIRRSAKPLSGNATDFDPVLKVVGDSRFVLIGEATHGTHEFYRLRAQITKRLITEKGFTAVAVEADWPDAYRINQFVRFESDDEDAIDALSGFQRFLRGCGATPTFWILLGGCATTMSILPVLVSMDWTCIACMLRFAQYWIFWTGLTPWPHGRRGIVTRASITLATTCKHTVTRRVLALAGVANRKR